MTNSIKEGQTIILQGVMIRDGFAEERVFQAGYTQMEKWEVIPGATKDKSKKVEMQC